jgi:uncharacterized protein
MKRTGLALIVCLLLASITLAQQNAADAPASKEDVEKFMAVSQKRELAVSMMATMTKQVHQMAVDQLKKNPSLGPGWVEHMDGWFDDFRKNFPIDELVEVQVPVYQKHFTHADIDALVAFYSTPTGSKYLAELPAITSESMEAMLPIVQKMMAKVTERIQEEVAQTQKSGTSDSTKKPEPN